MKQDQIGLQLYTVRDLTKDDMVRTLGRVADLGYSAVELAGFGDASAAILRRGLEANHLTPVAAHVGLSDLRSNFDATVGSLEEIGCHRLIVPWLGEEERSPTDGRWPVFDEIARLAERLAERGLCAGYHNHDFEFAPVGETTLWDALVERTKVELEIDVCWAAVGGRDPATLIGDLAGRVKLLHMKDVPAPPEYEAVVVGRGTLDWRSIVEAGGAAGVEWYIAEVDETVDPLGDAAESLRFLRDLAELR